ncbi:hypothetical protein M728_005545 (plasmid) [Ensifer sp. WSM1721]
MKEPTDRVDDSLHATRAAVEEGILQRRRRGLLRAVKASPAHLKPITSLDVAHPHTFQWHMYADLAAAITITSVADGWPSHAGGLGIASSVTAVPLVQQERGGWHSKCRRYAPEPARVDISA